MEGKIADLFSVAERISSILVFLFTTRAGLIALALVFVSALALKVGLAVRRASSAARSSLGRLGSGAAFLAAMEATFDVMGRILASLPTLALLAAASLSLVVVGKTVSRLEEAAAAAERIRELRAVVRNLERSVKVAEVRILSRTNGVTRLSITYYDPSSPPDPIGTKDIEIRGSDIYFDAVVLNFQYSEIEEGRRTNIAIPYRVFSDEVPQAEGVPLGAFDGQGIPYAFHRADADIYGIAPEAYRARLAELMEIAKTDAASRKEGIVRSLYGSAVHRRVEPGDVLEIRIEQSGGMTVKERFPF
jgi:hypothetical protein